MPPRKRTFITSEEQTEDMPLQITSMADIFVIILVFLLKSLSTGIVNITPTQGMKLPHLTTEQKYEFKEGPKVEVLAGAILVDQKPIVRLERFQLPNKGEDSSQENYDSLLKALTIERSKQKGKLSRNAASAGETLLMMADRKAPYATLKIVMNAAAEAGYGDLRLVVLGEK